MPDRTPEPGIDEGDGAMPGWVKVAIALVAIVVVAFVVMVLVGGDHGPSRH